MEQAELSPYRDPESHEAISDIIRLHSSNMDDVRCATFRELDLSGVEEVLDLGCGFGFMAEELARRIAPSGRVTGIDACSGNEESFCHRVEAAGRRARFQLSAIDSSLPWPDQSFDMSVCSFSLYFFEQIIPEVSRILRDDGLFVVLTHSEKSFLGLLRAICQPVKDSPLIDLIRRFSAENGETKLARAFSDVKRFDYSNTLTFYPHDIVDLFAYLRFKMPLIVPGAQRDKKFLGSFERRLQSRLSDQGAVVVEKDDSIFICRSPRRS